MSKRLIILVGPPGSGKSTWIEKEFQGECTVISTDNIIEEIAKEEGKTYDETFAKYIKVAERLMWEKFDTAIEEKQTPIVVDRTNMSVSSRRKFFERLRNFHKGHGYDIDCVVFPKPEESEWRRRLASRPGKTIADRVLNSMLASFQMPTVDEGFRFIRVMEPAISG